MTIEKKTGAAVRDTEQASGSPRKRRVFVVDDDAVLCRLLEQGLRKWGYEVETAPNGQEMYGLLAKAPFDIILLDVQLPDGSGIDFLGPLRDSFPHAQIIMMTAHGNIDMAIDAVRMGAYDFLTKPVDLDRLKVSLRNAVKLIETEERYGILQNTVGERDCFGALIGSSQEMQVIYEIIENVAASDCSVLIIGETGTGKELVAEEIHGRSARRSRKMIAVNCAAIPRELLESEMFGHEKGAFTGADRQKIGCAERADKSSLFLDEICEMDLALQAKMLRFLQNYMLTRVGGTRTMQVDIRLISAMNKDPQAMVDQGRMREDLLYRVNMVKLTIPPLRERPSDIPLLAESFLTKAARHNGKEFEAINEGAMKVLLDYTWPGNVRQLRNVISETVILNHGRTISPEMLPSELIEASRRGEKVRRKELSLRSHSRIAPIWQVEKEHIQRTLIACKGKVPEAAGLLEVSKATLYRKIKEYGLKQDYRA